LIVWSIVSVGCSDYLDPEVGALNQALCQNMDSNPDQSVSLANDIQPLFARSTAGCLGCHSPTGPTPTGITIGGLDLTSFETLTAGGGQSSPESIVIAGQPCDSILLQKIKPGPPFGSRMPLNGPPFWTDAEIQLLHDWIAEGALNN